MNAQSWLLPSIPLISMLTGLVIFGLRESSHGLRTALNLIGALTMTGLVAMLLVGVYEGRDYESALKLMPGITLTLRADSLAVLFVTLSAVLWLLTTIYAIGYLEDSPHRSRFFGFFGLCVSATSGVALAGNLMTFLIFYELLTLATYPLVVHRGTDKALRAGRIYLMYTLAGGAVLLFAIAWLKSFAGTIDFAQGGVLGGFVASHPVQLQIVFCLLIAGFGVKAALVPLHGWLPQAMVAPAPVSSLLHAVAVVKAGAFGIVRVVYEVFGLETAEILGLLEPLALVAAFTIIYGSTRALFQVELKKRLAYSTVSQVSYITLGAAIFGPIATIGGVVHLVHQGVMKITLFFTAGNYAEELGIHRIDEMDGVGRRMPLTSIAFTIGAIGMIGLPPLAGYISKSYLQEGGELAGAMWIGTVLNISGLLNAAYFLPILWRIWIRRAAKPWPSSSSHGETHWMLLAPPLVTAILVVCFGVFAETSYSPLYWAKLIAEREYVNPF
jgi:multicomponent Na+:H+ antiporter subunit D